MLLEETMDISLESLCNENQERFIRGKPNNPRADDSVKHATGVAHIELQHGIVHQHGFA